LLDSRLWCWLRRGSGGFLSAYSCARPNETSPFVIDDWVHIEDFFLQVLDIVVIEVKTSLEGTIRYPSLTLEQFEHLGEDFIEGHG
jgi:hypothetical protein